MCMQVRFKYVSCVYLFNQANIFVMKRFNTLKSASGFTRLLSLAAFVAIVTLVYACNKRNCSRHDGKGPHPTGMRPLF